MYSNYVSFQGFPYNQFAIHKIKSDNNQVFTIEGRNIEREPGKRHVSHDFNNAAVPKMIR